MEATQSPPSLEQVFQVLQQATSQNHAILKAAEQIFETYKMTPGFFETVQIIAADRNLPLHIRQMAIIQFKIVVPTVWRRSQLYPVDVKQRIRDRTLAFLDEPDDTIAKANAVAVAKIARIDYPRAWPTLDANIIAVIEANFQSVYFTQNATPQNLLGLRRSLESLNQVLKELTAAKVPAIATSVLELVNRIHTPLVTVYRQAYTAFTEGLSPATLTSDFTLYHIRIAHITFKCIAKCIIFLWQRTRVSGFEAVDKMVKEQFEMAVRDFQVLSNGRIGLFRQGLSQAMIGSQTQLLLSRHIHTYGKYFRKMQIFSSARFINLPQCQELVRYYWDVVVQAAAPTSPASDIQNSDEAIYPVKHLTKAMCIFKDSLAQWSPNRQGQEFIPPEFVQNAVNFIVTRLMLLDENDLEEWADDPETWVDQEESDSDAWEFGIRPCAERVLMTLANQYGDHIAPMIETYLAQVRAKPITDMAAVLQKEAVYCAVGRCAHRLKNHINFDAWINDSLEAEANDLQPTSRIIKRRIAWLFGRWFQENLVMGSRARVYGILVTLLQNQGEGSDPVVRLTAATALKDCIDSISFELDDFSPYLEASLVSLLHLLKAINSLDAKKRVLRVINCVISAAREKIADYLQFIAEPIITLWQELGDDIPLRAEIISTVTDLVKASDDRSALVAPACIVLVQQCLSPKLSSQLDQDALTLWLVTLRNSVPHVDSGLFQLLPEAVRLLNDNLDLLGQVTEILESYMLLDCPRVLQALPLHRAYLQVYNTALAGSVRQMLFTVSLMVQLSPSSQWAEAMHTSGFFAKLLDSVIEDKAKNENTLTLVEVINVFARMIMSDATVFVQLVAASARENMPETYLMNGFLDQWWAKWDNIIDAPRRKLHALAYAALLATGNRDVIERMPSKEPFEIWSDVLAELKEAYAVAPGDDEEDSPLIRFWKAQDDFVLPDRLEDAAETVENERRKQAWEQDIVRKIPLADYIQRSMQTAQATAQANGVNFQEALSKVDPTSIESLQKLLGT